MITEKRIREIVREEFGASFVRDRGGLPEMERLLFDLTEERVREIVREEFGASFVRDRGGLPEMERLLFEPNPLVRAAAVKGLAKLNDPDTLPTLRAARAAEKDPGIQRALDDAIARIAETT